MEEIESLKKLIKERLKMTSTVQEFINSFPDDENNAMVVYKVETIPSNPDDENNDGYRVGTPSRKEKNIIFLYKKVYSEEIVNFYEVAKDAMRTELYVEILGKNPGQTKEYFRIRSTFEERDWYETYCSIAAYIRRLFL